MQYALSESQFLLSTNLDAGELLTRNFQISGCIDSDYIFDDYERAKTFASISMDFIRKLIDHRVSEN